MAATLPVAREINGQQGTISFTRTSDTTLPMQVPLVIGGTVTIPAGQSSLALSVTPITDTLFQGSHAVIVSVAADFALVRDAAQNIQRLAHLCGQPRRLSLTHFQ
jgi:hypothetical protein